MQRVPFTLSIALAALAVLFPACQTQAGDVNWPGWRGPNRDGKSTASGLLKTWPDGGPKLLWKATGIGQGFSSVSFGGGLIYITGRKEAGNPSEPPEAKDVYRRPGRRLYITALDMDGKVRWVRDVAKAYTGYYKGTRSTITCDSGNLYLEIGTGEVGCYQAKTGRQKWTRDMSEFAARDMSWGFAESIMIVGAKAILSPGGDCFMAAVDKATGKTLWKSEDYGQAQSCSPIFVKYKGVPMIVNGSREGLMGVHAETGRTLWKQDFGQKALAGCPTPAYSDGYVYWAIGYGAGGICMKLNVDGGKVTAKEAWRSKDMDCMVGGYIIHDGYIYGNHKDGWTCLELKTGRTMWEAEGVGKGSICWADGMLYLFSEKDGLAGLATCSPKGLEMKGTFSVDGQGPSWAYPVVVGGRLYLRYDDNLYCYELRAK